MSDVFANATSYGNQGRNPPSEVPAIPYTFVCGEDSNRRIHIKYTRDLGEEENNFPSNIF